MKVLLKYSTILLSLIAANEISFAQPMNSDRAESQPAAKEYVNETWLPSLVPDGMIDRVQDRTNRTLAWSNVREIDIAFKRRVWKRIDVKEKQNMAFIYKGDEYTGGGAFIEILLDAVKRGKIRAFNDATFTRVLSDTEVFSRLSSERQVITNDPITGEETIMTTRNDFNPDDVAMYEIQEDWIFDRNVGRLLPRLRSVTAFRAVVDPDTDLFRGWDPLLTIYYPEAREVLSQYEVYNPQNDVHRMSWTDYLDRMMYNGYVTKTSRNNPTNGNNLGQPGFESLINGQKEMRDIIQKEMDMWEL